MLDSAQINVGRLLFWLGLVLGAGLQFFNLVHYVPGLGSIGISVIVATFAHALRRVAVSHDEALREAFELGRDHERLHALR